MSTISRRAAVAGGFASLGASALLAPAIFAQVTSTPDESTPDGDFLIDAANEARAIVESDRSSIPDGIDTGNIDAAIATADDLLATAASADEPGRSAAGAIAVLAAAESLILAALDPASLPSHGAATSQLLLRAHTFIVETGDRVTGTDSPDVDSLLGSGQDSYVTAYDAYGESQYVPAAHNASAGVQFAFAARILAGDVVVGGEREGGARRRWQRDRDRAEHEWSPGIVLAAPIVRLLHPVEQVDVPAPDFGA